jgi:hypothetical protein
MKCRIKKLSKLVELNNPQWVPGEGYADDMRGHYEPIMECKYVEELVGKVKCPVYYLIKGEIISCQWAGSVFNEYFEIINNMEENKKLTIAEHEAIIQEIKEEYVQKLLGLINIDPMCEVKEFSQLEKLIWDVIEKDGSVKRGLVCALETYLMR